VPKFDADHPAFFYALRGSQHRDRDLVNMLLTDLSRLDFRQLFICHKPLFYEAYRGWSDSKKDFVVRFLEQEYAMDKAGARDALFGREPKMMDTPDAAPKRRKRRANPWGPVVEAIRDRNDDDDDDDDWRRKSKHRRDYDRRKREERERKKKR